MTTDAIKQIQTVLFNEGLYHGSIDGLWGEISQSALDTLLDTHHVTATSFADPADVAAFRACKAGGKTDQECFRVGDNGIGAFGDDTTQGSGPCCALPPEDIEAKWGSVQAGHMQSVIVSANGKSVTMPLKELMPHKANVTNGAGIDLNPDAVAALGMTPPMKIAASWRWA